MAQLIRGKCVHTLCALFHSATSYVLPPGSAAAVFSIAENGVSQNNSCFVRKCDYVINLIATKCRTSNEQFSISLVSDTAERFHVQYPQRTGRKSRLGKGYAP